MNTDPEAKSSCADSAIGNRHESNELPNANQERSHQIREVFGQLETENEKIAKELSASRKLVADLETDLSQQRDLNARFEMEIAQKSRGLATAADDVRERDAALKVAHQRIAELERDLQANQVDSDRNDLESDQGRALGQNNSVVEELGCCPETVAPSNDNSPQETESFLGGQVRRRDHALSKEDGSEDYSMDFEQTEKIAAVQNQQKHVVDNLSRVIPRSQIVISARPGLVPWRKSHLAR